MSKKLSLSMLEAEVMACHRNYIKCVNAETERCLLEAIENVEKHWRDKNAKRAMRVKP